MKLSFCLLALLCSLLSSSQKPLQIGDTLPAQVLSAITTTQQQIPGNRQLTPGTQLFLLDFMSLSCISCLHALPKIDSLQQRYGFNVLLVTPDKQQRVTSFLQRKRVPFPLIAEDTLLKSYFPHQFISHIVWIYKNHVVAITRSDYITAANIQTLLSGESFSLPVKKDKTRYDYSASLLPPATGTQQYRSVLLPNIPGVPHRFRQHTDTVNGRRIFRIINYSLIDIYCKTFKLPLGLQSNQLSLSVSDTTRFIFDKQKHFRQQWNTANTYCYEASFPLTFSEQQCLQYIRTDLDTRFNLRTRLQQKEKDKPVLMITEQSKNQQ